MRVYTYTMSRTLAPRLIIGRIYKHLNEEMKLLWSKDLKLNTVHVQDMARACWHTVDWYIKTGRKPEDPTPIFNVADKQDTGKNYSGSICLPSWGCIG